MRAARGLKIVRILLLAVLAAGGALAQRRVEFQVIGGVPITESFLTRSFDYLSTGFHEGASATRRYAVGASVRIRLPHGVSVEVGVLYQADFLLGVTF